MSRFSPIWCAIIWCKPHCAVLNYLELVAPCRSIRDGKIRLNHADLHRTGWLYCAPHYIIAESAEIAERQKAQKSAERQIRRNVRKHRKANSQKGKKAQKGAERTNRPTCSDPGPVAAGCCGSVNRRLIWPRLPRLAFTHI